MTLLKKTLIIFLTIPMFFSCSDKNSGRNPNDVGGSGEIGLWPVYTKASTQFNLWSPEAEKVRVNLFENGQGGQPERSLQMEPVGKGVWSIREEGDLEGKYYTFQVMIDGRWLAETPGIYAQAVGVNGRRAMVVDLKNTDPEGWDRDKGPELNHPNEAIIYELHIRDMTIHPQSGSKMPGTYLGLVEPGTKGPGGVATGLDHLKDLGINYVHLLPTYDHYAINEARLDSAQFNWGYDPQNYNVPEGSFSSDPYHAQVRIKEFKQMVKAFHDNGIGVILDVVYNHTGRTEDSNFNLENPGYYYRFREDGTLSDASACGNETASEKKMMREFMLNSVGYWAKEYHLDGFRFDLMGIHDIVTMNEISEKLKKINPNCFVYGEGWTAGDSPLPLGQRAVKANVKMMPLITAFSDDVRDGLKGSVFDEESTGFVSGGKGTEESVKFGIVGSVNHPQIDYSKVNYSKSPWTNDPWQAISYVSCHDNHTLFDKLSISRPGATMEDLVAMDKLANAVVLTSQGVSFIHAGAEMLRTKKMIDNSYNLPDSINQIDWNWKVSHRDVYEYYKNLISLRKQHPAFRMSSGSDVRKNLSFEKTEEGLISYRISNNANNDPWKNILVIYNARPQTVSYPVEGSWQVAVKGDHFDLDRGVEVSNAVEVPPVSMVVIFNNN